MVSTIGTLDRYYTAVQPTLKASQSRTKLTIEPSSYFGVEQIRELVCLKWWKIFLRSKALPKLCALP